MPIGPKAHRLHVEFKKTSEHMQCPGKRDAIVHRDRQKFG